MKTLTKKQLRSKKMLGVSASTVAKSLGAIALVASMSSCVEDLICDGDYTTYADPANGEFTDSDTTNYGDEC